jgi:hypothetical protein
MFQSLSKNIRRCYAHAEACAQMAKSVAIKEARKDFLHLEKGWLELARNYEYAAELINCANEYKRRRDRWWGLHSGP